MLQYKHKMFMWFCMPRFFHPGLCSFLTVFPKNATKTTIFCTIRFNQMIIHVLDVTRHGKGWKTLLNNHLMHVGRRLQFEIFYVFENKRISLWFCSSGFLNPCSAESNEVVQIDAINAIKKCIENNCKFEDVLPTECGHWKSSANLKKVEEPWEVSCI